MEDEGAVVRGSDDFLRCVLLDGPIGHLDADNVNWFEHRKPKTFKGVKGNTLTMFVKEYTKKKAYFELSNETMKFASRSRVSSRASHDCGREPDRRKSAVWWSLVRTAQESTRPSMSGSVSRPPLRAPSGRPRAFVLRTWLQHAFHHLEKHIQETPSQYTMWRFVGNDHKESIEFKSDELSVDEESASSAKWGINGVTGSVRPCTDPKGDAKKERPLSTR